MRRTAGLYLLAAAVFALAVPQAGAAPAPAAAAGKAAVLTQTVTISGSQAGYVPVTVTKDMKLGNPFATRYRGAVTVTGGGDSAGFALIQDGLKGPILLGGRSEAYGPYVKDNGIPINNLNFDNDDGAEFGVPAGDYRLYLITGGKPTTVTLKFLGGSGSSRLSPTTKVESVVQQVDLTTPAPGPVGGVYSGGGAVTLTTPVLQLDLHRLDTSVHTESVQRSCFYLGAKPTGPLAYGPACVAPGEDNRLILDSAGGSTFLRSDEGVGPQSLYGFSASLTTSRTGEPIRADIAAGINFTTAGVVTSGDYTQYWLSLDGIPVAAPPRAPAPQQPPAEQPPAEQPPAEGAPETAADMLPATGLPAPVLVLAPALLLGGALIRRTRSYTR